IRVCHEASWTLAAGWSMSFSSNLSLTGTEEIKHECEAAQSARTVRVVCCLGDGSRRNFQWRKRTERRCKAAGPRRAGTRQKRRKEGREERRQERREKRFAAEVRPQG